MCTPLMFGNDVDSVDVAARTAVVRYVFTVFIIVIIYFEVNLMSSNNLSIIFNIGITGS